MEMKEMYQYLYFIILGGMGVYALIILICELVSPTRRIPPISKLWVKQKPVVHYVDNILTACGIKWYNVEQTNDFDQCTCKRCLKVIRKRHGTARHDAER